ncbi:LysE family translocator [Dokdonella koreensis]|uniref:Transport protein n=1 Tax=Dokdonella koreensis DS-123 TaxID=1300342 RepID=A0A160DXZ1_9GAMM|nr:LysE family translocator [Dokdonella koreensis]ANB18863.1 Transport protein [Dokdonella koreensis DS-123]
MTDLLPLLSYLLAMTVTPGPNNIMLTASGVNFGFRRTIPHIIGICLGSAALFVLCALLLNAATEWIAAVRKPLAAAGCAYLIWMAFKLARADAPGQAAAPGPIGFFGGALFQCVNPKAWIMVLNTAVLFLPAQASLALILLVALIGIAVGLPSLALWAWGGERLRRWLHRPWALQAFNLGMAGLLAGTALWLLADEFGSA